MKRILAMLVGIVFSAQLFGIALAEGKKMEGCERCACCGGKMEGSMEKKHAEKLEKMTKDLNLTADQKDKISAIMKDTGEKKKAEMQKMQDSMKSMHEDYSKKVKEVLTPEQQTKYATMMAEKKAKMEKRKEKREKKKERKMEKEEQAQVK